MATSLIQSIRNSLWQGGDSEKNLEDLEQKIAVVAGVFPDHKSITPAVNIDPECCFRVELLEDKNRFLVWINDAKLSGLTKEDVKGFFPDQQAARSLKHPNILTPLHIAKVGRYSVVVTENFDGELLLSATQNQKHPRDKAGKIFNEITSACRAAHDAGVMHRALSPANILVDSELNARVVGFGMANVFFDRWMTILKSKNRRDCDYIAPEILNEGLVASVPHCDGFSIGRVTYELLMGQPPKNAIVVLPSKICEVPTFIDDALLTAMHGDPTRRPQSVAQLREIYFGLRLREPVYHEPTLKPLPLAKSKGLLAKNIKFLKSGAFRIGIAIFFILATLAGGIIWKRSTDHPILVSFKEELSVDRILGRWENLSKSDLQGLYERDKEQFQSVVVSAYEAQIEEENFDNAHGFVSKMIGVGSAEFDQKLEKHAHNIDDYKEMMEISKASRARGDTVAEEAALAHARKIYPNNKTVTELQRRNPNRIASQLAETMILLKEKNPAQTEWHFHLSVTRHRVRLDLSGHEFLKNISPLHGQTIHELDLSRTGVVALDALVGIPIDDLRIDDTSVLDLEFVAGLPLQVLTFRNTPITDLSPVGNSDLLRCLIGQDDQGLVNVIRPPLPGQQTWINEKGLKFRSLPGSTVLVAETEFPDKNGNGIMTAVSFKEAENLCSHMTMRERQAKNIGLNQRYRLPTDAEWSIAAQLPESQLLSPKGRMLQRVTGLDYLRFRKARTILEITVGEQGRDHIHNGFSGMLNDIGEWVDQDRSQWDDTRLVRGILGENELEKLRFRAKEDADHPGAMISFRPVLETADNGMKWDSFEGIDPEKLAGMTLDSLDTPYLSAAASSSLILKNLMNSQSYRAAYISSPFHERDPFVNRHYLRVELPVTWAEAKSIAFQLGGQLATAENQAHLDWLRERFADQDLLGTPLWVGASALADESDWSWVSRKSVPGNLLPKPMDTDKRRGALLLSDGESHCTLSATPVTERHSFLVEWNDSENPGSLSPFAE